MTSSEKIHLNAIVPPELAGQRLDHVLMKLFPEHSRSRLQQWIRDGEVKVNQKSLKQSERVSSGEEISIEVAPNKKTDWEAQAIPLNIVYEDEAIIILNKPANLVVHPAAGNEDQTLVNALLHRFPELAQLPRAGLIHRLDKDTTGIMIVARSLTAHTFLVAELQTRKIQREYAAIVHGTMTAGDTIDAPIGRHPKNRLKMAVVENGKPAITHYRLLQRFRDFTYIKVQLETGRTHQIRVHLSHMHFPIVGDPLYGGRPQFPKACPETLLKTLQNFRRQALHAAELRLQHPISLEPISFSAPVPEDMQALLEELRICNA